MRLWSDVQTKCDKVWFFIERAVYYGVIAGLIWLVVTAIK